MRTIEHGLCDRERCTASSGDVVGARRANEINEPREDAPELERDSEEGADDGVFILARRG